MAYGSIGGMKKALEINNRYSGSWRYQHVTSAIRDVVCRRNENGENSVSGIIL